MNAKMLPPLDNVFDHFLAEIANLKKHNRAPLGMRVSFALWGRIEHWWRVVTQAPHNFPSDTIYGVPFQVDLALFGDSFILEAA